MATKDLILNFLKQENQYVSLDNKRVNEVCSMWHYTENDIGAHVKHLCLFSYCYFGQNKITTMCRFILVLTDPRLFEEKLSVSFNGHSFLPNDAILRS